MSEQPTVYKYFVFISYSRIDEKAAAWLQRRLEWFRFPVKLVPADHRPPHDRYVRPIYRDKTNLEIDSKHYWDNIQRALDESRFLVVLSSPHAAQSAPVAREINHFRSKHDPAGGDIIPLVLRGSVSLADSPDNSLNPALREFGQSLIDRNLPSMIPAEDQSEVDGWEQGFVGLASYLLALDRSAIGDHIRLEERRQARVRYRWLAAVAVLAVMAIIGGGIAWKQENERRYQIERSTLEEGRVWLERAKGAMKRNDHLSALMLAGRAVGYEGYGRLPQEDADFTNAFPLLLAKPLTDPASEQDRQAGLADLTNLIDTLRTTYLPLWTSVTGRVTSVAFSPDGSRLARGSDDGTIKLWDTATGKELVPLTGHELDVSSITFSPDGCRIASGSLDRTIKLWDVATGKELATFAGHRLPVDSVAFSPDGQRLASGSWDKTIKLWDAATGKELASLQGHTNYVKSVAFSPDGSRLASGSLDKIIAVWDLASGEQLASHVGHKDYVYSVAFSPDGSRLASGSADGTIKIWSNTDEPTTLTGHQDRVNSVAFSPDGSCLASGSEDGTIKLWDGATLQATTLAGHRYAVNSVAFSPDGSRLASGSLDLTVKLRDVASGDALATIGWVPGSVNRVVFNANGNCVASASNNGIKLWDVTTGKVLATLAGHEGNVTTVAFSPDGGRLASGSQDNTIRLWDTSTGKELATLAGHKKGVISVAFSADGRRLASGSEDATIKLWDAITGMELATLAGHTGFVWSVAFSADDSRLASGSEDQTVKVWDAVSGKELGSMIGHTNWVTSVAFNPSGSRVASWGYDQTYKLWDAISGKELVKDRADLASMTHWLAAQEHRLSPDGKSIISHSDTNHANITSIVPTQNAAPDLAIRLREGLLALSGRELEFPEIKGTTKMLPVRNDIYAQLADSKLTPERRAELRLELCTKSGQFRAATAQWEALQRGEWPGFEQTVITRQPSPSIVNPALPSFFRRLWWPKDRTGDSIPADSPIRRLYLLALIDATKHPQIHGHLTICQTAAQIAPVLTKEMMATPTISLAMMSLMQTLAKDDSPDMSAPHATLMKRLEQVATKKWLAVLRESTGKK